MFLISSISLSFLSSMLFIKLAESWSYSNNGSLYKYNPYYHTTSTSLSLSSLSTSSSCFRLSSKEKVTQSFSSSSSSSSSPLLTIAVTSSSRDLDDGCYYNNINSNEDVDEDDNNDNDNDDVTMFTKRTTPTTLTTTPTLTFPSSNHNKINSINRRKLLSTSFGATTSMILLLQFYPLSKVFAYTADPDKLQESLYFISRVQEATVQQERFITNAYTSSSSTSSSSQKELQTKLKLTLTLVEKNYKLLDQINCCSQYISPPDKLIESSEAGYQAVDELQNAIDFVHNDNNWSKSQNNNNNNAVTEQQRTYLQSSLQNCREQLFLFTQYIQPHEKLRMARLRVEKENVDNRIEFDNDIVTDSSSAGVNNPVILPWNTK